MAGAAAGNRPTEVSSDTDPASVPVARYSCRRRPRHRHIHRYPPKHSRRSSLRDRCRSRHQRRPRTSHRGQHPHQRKPQFWPVPQNRSHLLALQKLGEVSEWVESWPDSALSNPLSPTWHCLALTGNPGSDLESRSGTIPILDLRVLTVDREASSLKS